MSDERGSGYYLERIFSPELFLSFTQPASDAPELSSATVGWDWFPHSDSVFDVVLRVEVPPSQARQELVRATVVGRFQRVERPERPPFRLFVMQNAPAMLSPYLREAVSSLTMRGPFGPSVLPPMNVIEIMRHMQFDKSLGYMHVREHPELAAAYQVEVPPATATAHAELPTRSAG